MGSILHQDWDHTRLVWFCSVMKGWSLVRVKSIHISTVIKQLWNQPYLISFHENCMMQRSTSSMIFEMDDVRGLLGQPCDDVSLPAINSIMHRRSTAVVSVKHVSASFHEFFDHQRMSSFTCIMQWSLQQFISGLDIGISIQEELDDELVTILGCNM